MEDLVLLTFARSPFFSFGVAPDVLALALPPPLVSSRPPVCPGEGGARCCMLRAPCTAPPTCWGRRSWRWGRASCSRRDIETALPGLRRGVALPEGLSSLRMVRVGTRSVRRLWAVFGVPTLVRPFSSPGGRASGLVRDAGRNFVQNNVMAFGKGRRTKGTRQLCHDLRGLC